MKCSLREPLFVLALVAIPCVVRGDEAFDTVWQATLRDCKSITVSNGTGQEQPYVKVVKGKQLAEFLKVLALAQDDGRLDENEAINSKAMGMLELELAGRSKVQVVVDSGGLVVSAKPQSYLTKFKKRKSLERLWELMGAKLPDP